MKNALYLRAVPLLRLALSFLFCILFHRPAHAQTGAVPCPPNIDFSYVNLTNWICQTGTSARGIVRPVMTNIVTTGPVSGRHDITTGTGVDPYGLFPVVAPGGGVASLRLGNSNAGAEAERVKYFVHVPTGFNNYSFEYKFAVVLEDPNHIPADQPAFIVNCYDSATNAQIICASHTYVADTALNALGFLIDYAHTTAFDTVRYLPWKSGSLNLSGYGGHTIIVEVTSYDCTQGAHFGYGYFDVISCGRFAATVQSCDLNRGVVTFRGPSGYQNYQWYTSSWTYVGSGPSINVPAPASPTFYYCVLTPYIFNGCYDTITTRRIADFGLSVAPKSVCNTLGRPVSITSAVTGGIGGFTYSWRDPGSILSCTTCPNPVARPAGASYVTLTVSDSVGCFRSDTLFIQNPTFTVNLGPDRTTCIGTPIMLNPTITPPSMSYIYSWSPGIRLSDSTIENPVFTPSVAGTTSYVLRVDSGICAASDTIKITTLPNTFTIADSTICQGAAITPNLVGDTAFYYTFSPATYYASTGTSNYASMRPRLTPDSTITYTVTARYPTCPDIVRSVTYTVEPIPHVSLGADTVNKCLYQPLYLSASVMPDWFEHYSYTWRANDFIDNTRSPIIIFTGKEDTTLRLTVSTPLGCRSRDSVHVHVYNGDFGQVLVTDTSVCPLSTLRLTASGGVHYLWTPALYLSDTTGPTVIASPGTSTDYMVYVTDKNKCIDTVPVHLGVYAAARVSLPDSVNLWPGESYQIIPGGNGLYFSWFPTAGLSSSNISSPIASPDVNTLYYVKATTEAGCEATDSIRVLVQDDAAVDVPNAFTPGGEVNSDFHVLHRGIAQLKYLRVYNRWGTMLFETNDISKGWDGRYGGEPQPMGVYVYVTEGTTTRGRAFRKVGNVTLIR